MTFVISVARIASGVMRPAAWAVPWSVPAAGAWHVTPVHETVKRVAIPTVRTVWRAICALGALKKGKTMNTKHMTKRKSRQATNRTRVRRRELCLRFSPTAWAKLLYCRDKTDYEVGGFGVTLAEDLLYVQEFVLVKQSVTAASVRFDDQAVADFFEEQVDLGRRPEQFGRTWLHTHPAIGPEPSDTDEHTFARVFGKCQWAVMFIIDRSDRTYARLSFHVGPGGDLLIPTRVDYTAEFAASDQARWDSEYEAKVTGDSHLGEMSFFKDKDTIGREPEAGSLDLLEAFEEMPVDERHQFLDDLADRPELWDDESEVMFL